MDRTVLGLIGITLLVGLGPGSLGARAAVPDLAKAGLVDVTVPPYNADPSGKTDATKAIQQAMDDARQRHGAVLFPPGTYRVSDTLESALDMSLVRQGKDSSALLLGSHAGPSRPKLVLAPNTPGFGDPDHPKPMIYLWSKARGNPQQPQPNINYNQMIVNLDLDLGAGNTGAVGIDHDGAQGSGIEDVLIEARDGYAGIVGLQAGGGGTHGVTVIGGRYGIDAGHSAATAATVSGVTLIGQQVSAFRYNGLETCCLVGAKITVPPGATGPVIEGAGTGPTKGSMAIVDTQIEFDSPDSANVAIRTNRSVYLGNVWVRNSERLIDVTGGDGLPGNAAGWRQVAEYAHGVQPPKLEADRGGVQLDHVSYINGQRVTDDVVVPGTDGTEPPVDLQARHIWRAPTGWGAADMVSVKDPPFNAKGDDKTDDYEVLQRAIDEHEVVFLGRGRYRISRTLKLRANTVLVGLRQLSVIAALATPGGDFTDPENRRPLVESPDSADARTALIYVGIAAQDDDACYLLHWQSGRNSVVRSIYAGTNNRYKERTVRLSGHGGGRWWSLFKAARLIAEGTTEPLIFYQANPEWGWQPHMIFDHCTDVTIYGLKEEGVRSIQVSDCDRFNVYGYGGVANAQPGEALFLIERTPNLRLVGLIDRNFKEGTPAGKWSILKEVTADGKTIVTSPLDRLVLYQRGFDK